MNPKKLFFIIVAIAFANCSNSNDLHQRCFSDSMQLSSYSKKISYNISFCVDSSFSETMATSWGVRKAKKFITPSESLTVIFPTFRKLATDSDFKERGKNRTKDYLSYGSLVKQYPFRHNHLRGIISEYEDTMYSVQVFEGFEMQSIIALTVVYYRQKEQSSVFNFKNFTKSFVFTEL